MSTAVPPRPSSTPGSRGPVEVGGSTPDRHAEGWWGDWRTLLYAALFGVLMGLIALAFIGPIGWAERQAEHLLTNRPAFLFVGVILLPAFGGLLCGLVRRMIPLDLKGHGVSAVLYAVARRRSRLPMRMAIRQWLAATFTIISGGSAGPEGPIVTIGSVIGSNVGRLARLDRDGVTSFLGAGAAGGIAAVFNAPITGVFFALEILLRDFSLRTFAPIVVAAVLSSAATQTILGTPRPIFGISEAVADSLRAQITIEGTPAFVLLGVVCGVVAVGFNRSLRIAEHLFEKIPGPVVLHPALGGLALGCLGAIYLGIASWIAPSEASVGLPVFMGNGYNAVERLLSPAAYSGATLSFMGLLLGWLLLKTLATSLTLGSGGSGGLFAPALLIGALTGGAFGMATNALGFMPSATPAHFALVGMGGALAGAMHAPLSGMLLVYELTGDYSVILPLMLTATIATIVSRSLQRESAYTGVLVEQGVKLGTRGDQSLLRRLTVRDVPLLPPIIVSPTETAERLLQIADRCDVGEFVVIGKDDRCVGLIGGRELRTALVNPEALQLLEVSEIMRPLAASVTLGDTLDVALDRFGTSDLSSLPVLDAKGLCQGLLTRERLMRRYQDEMEQDA
ncbi:MAG: chloride channel protein [Phycisphaerae bacterium]|nr:chloride channel protein [Phycisphaerae bacterium]